MSKQLHVLETNINFKKYKIYETVDNFSGHGHKGKYNPRLSRQNGVNDNKRAKVFQNLSSQHPKSRFLIFLITAFSTF